MYTWLHLQWVRLQRAVCVARCECTTRQKRKPWIYGAAFVQVTGRNEVVAKVMFLLVSVILLTGGSLPQCMLGRRYPREGSTPWEGSTPPDTVNERPVRILLECILVYRKWLVAYCKTHCFRCRMEGNGGYFVWSWNWQMYKVATNCERSFRNKCTIRPWTQPTLLWDYICEVFPPFFLSWDWEPALWFLLSRFNMSKCHNIRWGNKKWNTILKSRKAS